MAHAYARKSALIKHVRHVVHRIELALLIHSAPRVEFHFSALRSRIVQCSGLAFPADDYTLSI